MDWLESLEMELGRREVSRGSDVQIIERCVGGVRYRLRLCAEGHALHADWERAVFEVRVRKIGVDAKATSKAARILRDACHAYWTHRRRGVDGQPCPVCRMIYDKKE